MTITRRNFVGLAALAPLAAAAAARGEGAPAACYDPASLPLSQKSRRRSVEYVEQSSDPAKHCSLCAFYTPSSSAGCGTCQILTGGTVNAGAVCSSFSPRAKAG